MKKVPRQCQAVTLAGTYSPSHRCLKRSGVLRQGAAYLCAHHRAPAEKVRA
ncbi:MAG: hypothetical protein KGL04_08405 [Elusimicrobia bacterium]|nr:hypothetical protein [Elusimicrobiota bacterium]MDE2314181.1 hypothetical protein [Elusimicrobiota bacterium]